MKIIMRRDFVIFYFENYKIDSAFGNVFSIKISHFNRKIVLVMEQSKKDNESIDGYIKNLRRGNRENSEKGIGNDAPLHIRDKAFFELLQDAE